MKIKTIEDMTVFKHGLSMLGIELPENVIFQINLEPEEYHNLHRQLDRGFFHSTNVTEVDINTIHLNGLIFKLKLIDKHKQKSLFFPGRKPTTGECVSCNTGEVSAGEMAKYHKKRLNEERNPKGHNLFYPQISIPENYEIRKILRK